VFYKKTFAVYANGANVMLLSVAARRGGQQAPYTKQDPALSLPESGAWSLPALAANRRLTRGLLRLATW